jgi:hypothetical protein
MDVVESWMPIIIDMCQSEREKGRRQPGGGEYCPHWRIWGRFYPSCCDGQMDHGSWVMGASG